MPAAQRVPLASRARTHERVWGLTPHTAMHLAYLLQSCPGLYVTSGARAAEKNRAVGGSPTSWHLRGRAVDLGGPLQTLVDASVVAKRQRITLNCTGPEEVLLEFAGTRRQHLHVAW